MAARKGKHVQRFSGEYWKKWKAEIEQTLEDGSHVLEQVDIIFTASELSPQLTAIKKVQEVLCKEICSDVAMATIVKGFVELHSQCLSRHPVQRTIASVLHVISQNYQSDIVLSAIISHLTDLIKEGVVNTMVDYVQSLMEHFPPGETVLHLSIPIVLYEFNNILTSQFKECLEGSLESREILLSSSKVLLNVLLHCQQLLVQLTKSCDPNDVIMTSLGMDGVSISEIHWPVVCTSDRSCEWLTEQLRALRFLSETLLKEADQFTRDLIISIAMLLVVTIAILNPSTLDVVLPPLCHQWLHNSHTSLPLLSQLAITHALIAKLSTTELTNIKVEGTQLLLWIFNIICNLVDKFTESTDCYAVSRTLSLWTNELRMTVDVVNDVAPERDPIKKLLEYIWSHWDDPIDGIRQQCKNMFDNLIEFYVELKKTGTQSTDHLYSLASSLFSLPSPTRGKYSLLSSLVPHITISKIISEWPHLPAELMNTMGHQILACKAGDLWCKLVYQHYKEVDNEIWKQTWVVPLVTTLLSSNSLPRLHIKQYCLSILFTTSPCAMDIINETITCLSHDLSCDLADMLTVQLLCMSTGSIVTGPETKSSEKNYFDILNRAICHGDDQVVVSALQIVCDSKRTTDLPSIPYLPVVLECVRLHLNSQSPWFRQQVLALLKKLFLRISDGCYRYLKEREKKHLNMSDDVQEMILQYKDFLSQLIQTCFHSLEHPLGTFQRRYFALSILQLMSDIFQNTLQQFEFLAVVPNYIAQALVYIIWDTFDSNRQLALQLVKTLNTTKLMYDDSTLTLLIQHCYQLITGPKYTSCTTGCHLLTLLIDIAPQKLIMAFSNISGTPILGLSPSLLLIKCLMAILCSHMTKCRQNLIVGSISTPMYGVIQAIRGVWTKVDLQMDSDILSNQFDEIQSLIINLIDLCVEVGKMVSPIVCNSSPEGFLPSADNEEGEGYRHGNSQSVLLCCWHCMKEVVLLLAAIIQTSQEVGPKMTSLLTTNEIEVISTLLIQQLTEARHRGAFEMSYVGFSKLCHYLWTSNNTELQLKPTLWIKELLLSLQSSSLTQLLSITRRSAGLPFYCQAIVITEPKNRNYSCLKEIMTNLLTIATAHSDPPSIIKDDKTNNELVPQPSSVHALNILRGLFRESKLGELVIPYVAVAIKIAIEGFKAQFWPIRNSCTLLLSALIARVFGVKRVQDERSIENKMTSREFFARFPSLHSFLLETLETALQKQLPESLFPVLMLLSRLYPSPLDDVQSSLSLLPFQAPLIRAASNPVWKCRVLVAHAFLPTVTPHTVATVLSNLLSKLVLSNQNQLHGLLLIVEAVLSTENHDGIFKGELRSQLDKLLHLFLTKRYIGQKTNQCVITRGLYLKCVMLFFQLMSTDAFKELPLLSYNYLLELILDCQNDLLKGEKYHLDMELVIHEFSLLLKITFLFPANEIILSPLKIALLSWQQYPNVEVIYECIRMSVFNRELTRKEEIELATIAIKKTEDNLQYSYQLLSHLFEMWNNDIPQQLDIDWFNLFNTTVTKLSTQCLREEVKVAMIHWCSYYLKTLPSLSDIADLISTLLMRLYHWCDDIYPDNVRIAITNLLGNNWYLLTKLDEPVCSSSQSCCYMFWSMVVTLLQDVEEEVRSAMCCSLKELLIQSQTSEVTSFQVSSLCQQSTLHNVILLIPTIYKEKLIFAFSLLRYLAEMNPSQTPRPPQDSVSSLLFEEDQTNSYVEPVQLVEYITDALRVILPILGPDVLPVKEFINNVKMSSVNVNVQTSCTLGSLQSLWLLRPDDCRIRLRTKIFSKLVTEIFDSTMN